MSLLPEHVVDIYITGNFKLVDDKCNLAIIFSKISDSTLDNRLSVGTKGYTELLKSYVMFSLQEALLTDLRANKWLYDTSDGTTEYVTKEDLFRVLKLGGVQITGVCIKGKKLIVYPYYDVNRLKLSSTTGVTFLQGTEDSNYNLAIRGNGYTGVLDLNAYLPLHIYNSKRVDYILELVDCKARLVFSVCAVLLIRLNNSTLDVSLLYEDLANFYIRCNLKVVTGQCDFTTILFMASQQVIDRRLEAGSERYIGLLKYYVKDSLLNLDKCLTDNIWLYNMYKSDIIEYVEKEIEDQPDIQVEHCICV